MNFQSILAALAGPAAMMSAAACPVSAVAQIVPAPAIAAPPYTEIVPLVLRAPLVLDVRVRSAARIRGAEAAGVAPGLTRFYVQADVTSLIRGGTEGTPARVGWVADLPLDARGRPPRLNRERLILFARPVPGSPGELQLAGLDAQRTWTPELDALVRRIAAEVVRADAPPTITGIGNAFHVPGSLPGEGETQIFLNTADRRPVSLTILRRPGEETRWAVALSEIVDEAAAPPERETLLWYKLACGLPRAIPERSLASLEPTDAATAREDYQFVLSTLGPCADRGAEPAESPAS